MAFVAVTSCVPTAIIISSDPDITFLLSILAPHLEAAGERAFLLSYEVS
jgi:hypothetical protein